MKVLLDDQTIEPAGPTLAAALQAGREAAEGRGRVIVEAYLDGRALSEEELGEPSPTKIDGSEVRFLTAEPRALVRVTLQEVCDLLPACERDQQVAAEMIQSGRLQEAFPRLADAMTAWQNVQSAVENGAALVGLDIETLSLSAGDGAEEELLSGAIAGLAKELEEIKRCLRAQDWSGLSDALAYPMQDQARRWRGLLGSLTERVGRS